jgi:C-terminal processing protease CtpA/Prc
MVDAIYRVVSDEVVRRNANKEALIVDTRFNGGGWLHDDLATFLSGKKYVDMQPRGQKIGFDPQRKWTKPSVVLVGESNYSDAHFFPFVYKELGIGKLIGMPVPGTATAVWWEPQIDQSLYFGIPQVGIVDKSGKYLENQQLEVDVEVAQDPDVMISGRDQQIEKAVEVLLKDLGKK